MSHVHDAARPVTAQAPNCAALWLIRSILYASHLLLCPRGSSLSWRASPWNRDLAGVRLGKGCSQTLIFMFYSRAHSSSSWFGFALPLCPTRIFTVPLRPRKTWREERKQAFVIYDKLNSYLLVDVICYAFIGGFFLWPDQSNAARVIKDWLKALLVWKYVHHTFQMDSWRARLYPENTHFHGQSPGCGEIGPRSKRGACWRSPLRTACSGLSPVAGGLAPCSPLRAALSAGFPLCCLTEAGVQC